METLSSDKPYRDSINASDIWQLILREVAIISSVFNVQSKVDFSKARELKGSLLILYRISILFFKAPDTLWRGQPRCWCSLQACRDSKGMSKLPLLKKLILQAVLWAVRDPVTIPDSVSHVSASGVVSVLGMSDVSLSICNIGHRQSVRGRCCD